MITSLEFDEALQLIADYKLQLDKQLETGVVIRTETVNIRQDIKDKTFNALHRYYELHYDISLEWEDLMDMDRDLLAAIDYDELALVKGFGRSSVFNLKKLMVAHSVLDEISDSKAK
jgi:hypothetical protein